MKTIGVLKSHIRKEMATILPDMLRNVADSVIYRIELLSQNGGKHMEDIIFHK